MVDKILLITPDVDVRELAEFLLGDGGLPAGSHLEDFQEFTARGRVEDCDCGLIVCECVRIREHEEGCHYRTALLSPLTIPCDAHKQDFCIECDCTCKARKEADEQRRKTEDGQ